MITCTSAASLFSELKTRIDTRQARVGVIGLGYVGLLAARSRYRPLQSFVRSRRTSVLRLNTLNQPNIFPSIPSIP
jgi:hypothetical protein